MVDPYIYEKIKNFTFLIVDDVGNMRTILKRMLRNLNFHNILDASDGQAALDLLHNRKIDFVIADWRMPNLSGIDLLKILREEQRYRDIPYIIITGEVEEKKIIMAAECEIDGYIIKPFFAKTLEDKIYAIIERKQNPQPFENQLRLAENLLEAMEFEKALEACNKAIELKPQSARAQSLLGKIHLKLGDTEKGEEEIKKAITLNPMYIRAHEELAEHYEKSGDTESALKFYEEAAKISPHNIRRQLSVGKLYLKANRLDKANKAFALAEADVKEGDATIISEIGEAYLAGGYDDEAIKAFQKNLRIDERDLNAYNKLGIALRKQGRHMEAIQEYEKALVIDRNDEVLHYNIARAYNEMGEWEISMRHIQRALELDPGFKEALEFKKVLLGE